MPVVESAGKLIGIISRGDIVHYPPGGATALIAVIGSSRIHALGFWYALVPAGLGAVLMLVIALLVNNLSSNRRYPEFWF